jgi:biopolymer transport protein ExbD
VSTDSLALETSKGITVPMVMNGMTTGQGSRLDISAQGVSWNGQQYLQTENFDVKKPLNGQDGWKALEQAIAATAAQEKTDKKFDGKLLLQADRKTPFPVLQEVLRVAKGQGYKDIRFVGAKYN